MLQLAKLDLIKTGKADPFYWAGFVLIGDASPIDLSVTVSSVKWTWAAVFLLVAGLIAILVSRKIARGSLQDTRAALAPDTITTLQ